MISIQNAYSLLNRTFEGDLAEISMREHIGLLAYSPMAFGVLSGKYIKGTARENARLKLFPNLSRYNSKQSTEATKRYLKIAEDHNLTLAQMALAFVNQQSIHVTLNDEVLKAINAVHAEIPNPAP
jgi:aryl-alcohol dehydrogenase-like predicted oxidoreductase